MILYAFPCCNWSAWFISAYALELLQSLVLQYEDKKARKTLKHSIDELKAAVPPSLADGMVRPDKDLAIQSYASRFSR